MNLMERESNKTDKDILQEDEGIKDHGTENYDNNRNLIYILIAFVFLCLIILIFVLWMNGKKQNDTSQITQQIETNMNGAQTEIISDQLQENNDTNEPVKGNDEQTDIQEQVKQDVLTGGSTPIIVEEDKDHTASPDVLLKPQKQMDPLDQDFAYEDYSYEKEYIMKEMSNWWDESQVTALYDLSALRRYRKLSYSLKGTNQYYYFGDTDSEGKPHGKGCAMYADDAYYFGDFVHGDREGTGYWLRFYYDSKMEGAKNGIYTMHSYAGEWKNDLPDGEGQEHFDVDLTKIPDGEVVFQNIIGKFSAGLYDGAMYANSVESDGNVCEWDAEAKNGVFELKDSLPASGNYPVWQNRADETRILRIDKGKNQNCGISELIK